MIYCEYAYFSTGGIVMKNDRKQWIYLIFQWLLTLSVVAAGICLMAACLQVYHSGGEQLYTPEKVAAAFRPISLPVYICLGLIVVSFILPFVLKRSEKKLPRTKDVAMELKRLRLTRDPAAADEEKKAALEKLRKGLCRNYTFCAAAGVVCVAVFLTYALNGANFTTDNAKITESVVASMYVLLPCSTVAFGCCVLSAYLANRNREKQIALLKQCPPLTQKAAPRKDRFVPVFRYVVLGLAMACMVYGLATGGWQDVLTKAVNICTECVGLG